MLKRCARQFVFILLTLCMAVSHFCAAGKAAVMAEDTPTAIYFLNSDEWSEVGAYTYNPELLGSWGTTTAEPAAELGGDWLKVTVSQAPPFSIIFYNKANDSERTELYLDAPDKVYVARNGQAYTTKEDAEKAMEPGEPVDPGEDKFIYFLNSAKWEKIGAYVYGDKGEVLGGWGNTVAEPAEELGGDWVKVKTPELPPFSIIFYNWDKDSERTEQYLPDAEHIYLIISNESFTSKEAAEAAANATPTSIHFLNWDGEKTVFDGNISIYAYADAQPVGGAGWPGYPASASSIGDNWYEVSIPRNASSAPFIVIVNGDGADQLPDLEITRFEDNYITVAGDRLFATQTDAEKSVGITYETVMYYLNSYEWPAVNAYVYGEPGQALGSWPGAACEPAPELGDMWVKVTVPAKQPFNIIFFNTESPDDDRAELLSNPGMNYVVGSKANGDVGAYSTKTAAEAAMGMGDPDEMTTLHFYNYNNRYDGVNGYFFTKEGDADDAPGIQLGNDWPGKAAAEDPETGEDWWVITVPQNAEKDHFFAIFNDGINQTADLLIKDKKNVYITPGGQLFDNAPDAEKAAAEESLDDGCEEGPNADLENYDVTYPEAGAALPYITYEAEIAETNAEVLPYAAAYRETVQSEASGREAVKLNAAGDYVTFTLTEPANSLVSRYCIPDSADGKGIDSTLSLYINGEKKQALDVTSRYAWVYGSYPFTNNVSQGNAHRFFDETRVLFDETYPAGTTVTLQKDADDTADYYIIDFIEAELVGAPKQQPADSLSVTDFGAVANDGEDDYEAFADGIEAAKEQSKTLWIPAGDFDLTEKKALVADGVTIEGAGMWYTNLNGEGAAFKFQGTSKFYDFAMTGEATVRKDSEDLAGFENAGKHATNITIQNIWMEHIKVGVWSANTDRMVIQGSRIRNTFADGINLCSGTNDTTVRNNNLRNTGDDCIAIWPWVGNCTGNTIAHNTVQVPTLANGVAIYGGGENTVDSNHVMDTINNGAGIVVGSEFSTKKGYTGSIIVTGNLLERTGSMQTDENYPIGAIWLWSSYDHGMDLDAAGAYIRVKDNTMLDNTQEGILIEVNAPLTGVYLESNTIDGATDGIYEFEKTAGGYGGGSGWGKYSNMVYRNLTGLELNDKNPNFNLEEGEFPEAVFDDVQDPDRYYYEPVYWAYYHDPQITTGTKPNLFTPDGNVTRGQMVTFLWRLAGTPEPGAAVTFEDVDPERYYADAIAWANEEGITTGYAGGVKFGPDDNCTREQIVTFLWRYAGEPEPGEKAEFTDVDEGRYFVDAVSWAAEKGITVGLNDGTGRFGVGMTCTRAMAVTFLFRYAE